HTTGKRSVFLSRTNIPHLLRTCPQTLQTVNAPWTAVLSFSAESNPRPRHGGSCLSKKFLQEIRSGTTHLKADSFELYIRRGDREVHQGSLVYPRYDKVRS